MSGLDFLARMAASSRERLARERLACPPSELERRAADAPPVHPLILGSDGFDVIAEIKLSSPSEGILVEDEAAGGAPTGAGAGPSLPARASEYVAAGAAAVSVLTEPESFRGSLEHLADVSREVTAPVLRKDFLVDPYQVLQARAYGASGVLLIVRILDDDALERMARVALSLGMFVLVESFDGLDLERATRLAGGLGLPGEGPQILLGLNSRDLATLEVRFDRFAGLADRFPEGLARVAESGLSEPGDAAAVAGLGYDMALVGSALMKSPRPAELLGDLLRAGRTSARTAGVGSPTGGPA